MTSSAWLTPRHRHDLILARPVAYVTPCGGALWLRGRYQTALAGLRCDHVITDPPYSERTHKGHNDGVKIAGEAQAAGYAGNQMRVRIEYAAWSAADAHDLMRRFNACGWIVAMCDHALFLGYEEAAKKAGRVTFAPVVWYAPGSRVRMQSDGPACWTTQIAISRRSGPPWSKWGSLPGGYLHTTSADKAAGDYRIGGKPLALMVDLVRDYSREGDTVCDPCGGYATTGVAALRMGRRFIGVECDPEAWAHGRDRLAREARQTRMVLSEVQESLI